MMAYRRYVASADGWSEWIQPVPRGYRMACCDCGLVHTVDFRVRAGRIQFRVARNNRSTGQIRRHDREKLDMAKKSKGKGKGRGC
jgi:hypothetical protein